MVEELGSLSLTHVQYVKGDIIGYFLAWCSLVPIFLLVAFVTLILFRRDIQTVVFFLGLLINECINVVLKQVIKDPRPQSDLIKPGLFVEYGMPSSHAQFMGFFATYFSLLLFIRTVLSEEGRDCIIKFAFTFCAFSGSFLCCVSRVYLNYHSSSQVVNGVIIGAVIGVLWFITIEVFAAPKFPKVYFWKISDMFMIKDASLIPNYLWYEYTAAKRETLNRLKRKST